MKESMKVILFGLLMMIVAGSSVMAQTDVPEVLGVVNGVKITKQDLSPETQSRIAELQNSILEARQRELDLQIDAILLEAEAKKRGVTPSQVIKDEVIARVQAPAEAEAQAFYDKNKASIKGEFRDEKNNVIEYLRYQRQQELAQKLAERLRASAQVKVLAKPTAPPATAADRGRVLATVNDKQI